MRKHQRAASITGMLANNTNRRMESSHRSVSRKLTAAPEQAECINCYCKSRSKSRKSTRASLLPYYTSSAPKLKPPTKTKKTNSSFRLKMFNNPTKPISSHFQIVKQKMGLSQELFKEEDSISAKIIEQ